MKSPTADQPPIAVRRAAMDLLARREQSFHELLDKLTTKFPDFDREAVIRPALERLRAENLQSDSRFANAWVNYRAGRGVGPLKIASELQPRKLDRELLNGALYLDGPDWEEKCYEVLCRKFRVRSKPTREERARWQRFLMQRGFDHEQIRAAVKKAEAETAGGEPDD
ncbi:MAG TPA: regulatory protein RecX [Pseudomonadales bacterium]